MEDAKRILLLKRATDFDARLVPLIRLGGAEEDGYAGSSAAEFFYEAVAGEARSLDIPLELSARLAFVELAALGKNGKVRVVNFDTG